MRGSGATGSSMKAADAAQRDAGRQQDGRHRADE